LHSGHKNNSIIIEIFSFLFSKKMHRAITSTTMQAARKAHRFASSSMLKRPVNARPRKVPRFARTQTNQNSTLALEQLARVRGSADQLSWSQIRAVMACAALPMVGFGFMDNFVMIQAGSYIDSTLGVKFGLATMTAAAMGQVVSDVSGVVFGSTIERMLSPWVKPANLTFAQQNLAFVRRLRVGGAVLGVIVGCCLGATSLLFVFDSDSGRQPQAEQLHKLQEVLQDMLACDEMKGASCTMHMRNNSHILSHEKVAVVGLSKTNTFAAQCAEERQMITDGNTLYVPVLSKDDTVAVLELKQENGFSMENTDDAQRMARHIGIFMNRLLIE
jgi:hypothetical protein